MRSFVAFGASGASVSLDDLGYTDETLSRAVEGPHDLAARVDVLFDRATVVEGVNVVDGTVTFDRTALIVGRCDVTIADPDRIPVGSADVLTPFGYELLIWRGVRVGGYDLLCPLGVFPIQRSAVTAVSKLSRLSGMDRGKLVSDATFTDVYSVASGTNYATAIEAVIQRLERGG
jgi:hypothetical protein